LIKCVARFGSNRRLVGLGLSAVNIRFLQAGNTLMVPLEELVECWPGSILLFAGRDEGSMGRALNQMTSLGLEISGVIPEAAEADHGAAES